MTMESVVTILNRLWESTVNFIPNLVGALILLAIGWVVGTIVGRITREILRRLKVDEYITRSRRPFFRVSDIFKVIVEWSIYLAFMQAAVGVLGIEPLESFFEGILAFIPGLIKAIITIIVGYAIANYVSSKIKESKVSYSDLLGNALFFLIVYVSVALALPSIGIDPFIVNAILLVILGTVGIGLAIAIGLGLKDVVAKAAKKYFKKL